MGSVRALGKSRGRGYRKRHAEVQVLAAAGLLDPSDNGVQADYDVIKTRIAL